MRKSTLSGITALLLAGVMAGGVCACGYASRNDDGKWFSNGNISTWHWTDKAPIKGDNGGDNGDIQDGKNSAAAGGAIVSDSENHGISLMSLQIPVAAYAAEGIDAQADTAYKLTATITPDIASDKSVNWSVAWVNAGSTFASGKTVTDYVTITPTADGALTANLTCLKDFGEPIIVTVTSRDNAEVNSTCQVDYRKRIILAPGPYRFTTKHILGVGESRTYTLGDKGYVLKYTQSDYISDDFVIQPWGYSAYTVDDTWTCTITRELTDEFYNNLRLNYPQLKKSVPFTFGSIGIYIDSVSFLNAYGLSTADTTVQNVIVEDLRMLNGKAHEILHIHYESEYSTYDTDIEFSFNPSTLVTRVTGADLDKDNIII